MIDVQDVSVHFGGVTAVDHLSVDIPAEISAIVGPNGAGKTTLFNGITGYVPIDTGRVDWSGTELTSKSPQQLRRLGISRTFQHLELFTDLTVTENVIVGLHHTQKHTFVGSGLQSLTTRNDRRRVAKEAAETVELLNLGDVAGERVEDLSFGVKKIVALARALVGSPKLLMLDEPGSGLNDSELMEMEALLRRLHGEHEVAILFIEHNISFVSSLAEWVLAMDAGRVVCTGTPQEVFSNSQVAESYLGK